jgi:uncharacterized membrane protein
MLVWVVCPEEPMEFNGTLFSPLAWWWTAAFIGSVLLLALWKAPWMRLLHEDRYRGYFAAITFMMLLWLMRTQVIDGLQFHLLGVTTLTLMFGWALGFLGAALALLGVTLGGWATWHALPFNLVTLALVPVSVTFLSLLLVRHFLPKHYIVFIFGNAFVTGGLTGAICGYMSAFILVWNDAHSLLTLQNNIMPFFPIMFFPEGVFNGWMTTLVVVFRPQWIYSFRDEEYLANH